MSSFYATCDLYRYHNRRLIRILHDERILGKLDGQQYKRELVETDPDKFEGYSLLKEDNLELNKFEMKPYP
jgi:hypothetical protein